jgi:hypothetical protein
MFETIRYYVLSFIILVTIKILFETQTLIFKKKGENHRKEKVLMLANFAEFQET